MATVIRAARISGDPVTLDVRQHPAAPAQPATPPAPTAPAAPAASAAAAPRPEAKPPAAAASVPAKAGDAEVESLAQAEDRIWKAIREREKQLQDRERVLEEGLASDRRQAREQAYADGFKKGEQDGAAQYQERLESLRNLADSIREKFDGEISGVEDTMVDIVFEAVCKIVGHSLHDRDGVRSVVREVASRVKDQEKLVLRVSPRDYELLTGDAADILDRGIRLELVADDRVVLGGCLIETPGGTIDGRLEIQLQQLRDVLLGARRMLPE